MLINRLTKAQKCVIIKSILREGSIPISGMYLSFFGSVLH